MLPFWIHSHSMKQEDLNDQKLHELFQCKIYTITLHILHNKLVLHFHNLKKNKKITTSQFTKNYKLLLAHFSFCSCKLLIIENNGNNDFTFPSGTFVIVEHPNGHLICSFFTNLQQQFSHNVCKQFNNLQTNHKY